MKREKTRKENNIRKEKGIVDRRKEREGIKDKQKNKQKRNRGNKERERKKNKKETNKEKENLIRETEPITAIFNLHLTRKFGFE